MRNRIVVTRSSRKRNSSMIRPGYSKESINAESLVDFHFGPFNRFYLEIKIVGGPLYLGRITDEIEKNEIVKIFSWNFQACWNVVNGKMNELL